MDELFLIEKHIGTIQAIIGLQYLNDPVLYVEDKWEEYAEPVMEEKKAKVVNEDGEEE